MSLDTSLILASILLICIVVVFFISDNRKKNGLKYGLILAKVVTGFGMVYFVIILVSAVLLQSTSLIIFGILSDGLILSLIGEIWHESQ